MVLPAGIGIDGIERIAGAPSPRSTMCRSLKFTTGQRTRSSASGSEAWLLMVMDNGRSAPVLSDGGTDAFESCNASLPAPNAGGMQNASNTLNPARSRTRLLLAVISAAWNIDQVSDGRRLNNAGTHRNANRSLGMMMLVLRCTDAVLPQYFLFLIVVR